MYVDNLNNYFKVVLDIFGIRAYYKTPILGHSER